MDVASYPKNDTGTKLTLDACFAKYPYFNSKPPKYPSRENRSNEIIGSIKAPSYIKKNFSPFLQQTTTANKSFKNERYSSFRSASEERRAADAFLSSLFN